MRGTFVPLGKDFWYISCPVRVPRIWKKMFHEVAGWEENHSREMFLRDCKA